MNIKEVFIKTDYIKLDQFLKWCGIAESGGIAQELINSQEVTVNGEPEMRRGRKLRHGDKIDVLGKTFLVCNTGESIDT